MKKWVNFKFKNLIWLYGLILFAVVTLLIFFMIKEGEPLFAIAGFSIIIVVFAGIWFSYHYGIRISEKGYLIICNRSIKFFKREKVSSICFYFVDKGDDTYDVVAKVIIKNKSPYEFVWTDFYTHRGGKLKFNVKQSEIDELIQNLTADEKINAKII